jgi:hypothetical protein
MSSPQKFWTGLANALDRPDLFEDPRFSSRGARIDQVCLMLEAAAPFGNRPLPEDRAHNLEMEGMPHAPAYDSNEALETPQAKYLELLIEAEHLTAGTFRTVRNPLSFDGERSNVTMTRVRSLVVVDQGVEDWRTLTADLATDAKLVVLDPARDGVTAIADAVAPLHELAAIHIVSHGNAGEVRLGAVRLSAASLDRYTDALARIGGALSDGGDILLYGCDVARGEQGRAFVERLADITGADVAAATHPVGASMLGGSERICGAGQDETGHHYVLVAPRHLQSQGKRGRSHLRR